VRVRGWQPVLVGAFAAWLLAVVVIAILRVSGGGPSLAALACTPDRLVDGRVLTLLSSTLPVGRLPFGEIAGLAAAAWAVWRLAGIAVVWVVGLSAHVGCTLIAYGALGVVWLADRGLAGDAARRSDYGISAVWLGLLGYLSAALWHSNRRVAVGIGVASAVVSLALAPLTGAMTTAEHLLALAIGWLLPTTISALRPAAADRATTS
jgi:hypothetical protein